MRLPRSQKSLRVTGLMAGLVTLLLGLGTLVDVGTKVASAADCTANSIIKCGASSKTDFIDTVRSGNGGTQKDLATIYADYGLTPAEYNRFVTSAQAGTAFNDGRIVVDGHTVATNARSIGRSQKPNAHAKTIGGKIYWESRAQDVMTRSSTPVWVMFDDQGKMQFAVMSDCGNPTQGQPVTPSVSCQNLISHKVDRTTYMFSTSIVAAKGATIDHVVYDFGDGTSATRTDATTEVRHAYARSGSFTAQVTVFVKLPGQTTAHPIAVGNCIKHIVVSPPPVMNCSSLTVTRQSRTVFKLTGVASGSDDAEVEEFDFDVEDAAGTVVASRHVSTTARNASTMVTVANTGDFTAKLRVQSSENTKTAVVCTASFNVPEQPTPTPTPSKPSVMIQKDVDGVQTEQVTVGQTFTYHIKVTNNGDVDVQNAVVVDTPPLGVTLMSADIGTVNTTDNSWRYVIPTLVTGESQTFSLTANVPTAVEGTLVNKACVSVASMLDQQLCDTATVTVMAHPIVTTTIPTPTTPQPQPVTELPNTGAGNVIGVFFGVVATGAVLYRFVLSFRSIVRPSQR